MSAESVTNPPTSADSKSARKKKAKAEAAAAINKPSSDAGNESAGADAKLNGHESSGESPYIRELQKNIRNVNKKLSLMQKVDSIIAENPGVSLDDLVASRKINQDQKAQALKKPALQAQLTQLEEQIAQYKKFDQEYQQRLTAEKELLQSSHKEELEKLRDTIKAENEIEQKRLLKQRLLTFSRFLRAAAARRQNEDDDSDVGKGFEGALLLVYGGDAAAVDAAEKLIDGTDDQVTSTEGQLLNVTYKQINEAALEEAPLLEDDVSAPTPAEPEHPTAPVETTTKVGTDPTVAHAGLTEIDTTTAVRDGEAEITDVPSTPATASIDVTAANAAAESQWDTAAAGSDDPLAESFEMVPRDPTEVETPSAPAAATSTQSWADETTDAAASTPDESAATTSNGNDGFHEVQHHYRGNRGRGGFTGDQRGGFRGRGRGDGRGRGGFRGEGRGRGRGGFRGGRGRGESS